MNILMHMCCAPCAVYPMQILAHRGERVTGFWFNPNIHPYREYRNRLEGVRRLQALWKVDVYYEDAYGLVDFVRSVAGMENQRCTYCYAVRLEATARRAKAVGFDAFTTSLLVSPYQQSAIIQRTALKVQEKLGISFLGEDFTAGYREGRRIARELDLYRQQYCGCIYSEMERFLGTKGHHAFPSPDAIIPR